MQLDTHIRAQSFERPKLLGTCVPNLPSTNGTSQQMLAPTAKELREVSTVDGTAAV